jgi:branched-chain amino acid transport system permease protein
MTQFIDMLLIGLGAGSIYALMAIAMVLVWRSTRVINFAQAAMALLSTYIGFELVQQTGNFWIALPLAMALGALVSALVEILLIRTLIKHSSSGPVAGIVPIIATLGLLGLFEPPLDLFGAIKMCRFNRHFLKLDTKSQEKLSRSLR